MSRTTWSTAPPLPLFNAVGLKTMTWILAAAKQANFSGTNASLGIEAVTDSGPIVILHCTNILAKRNAANGIR